jgi:hypothetical protein
MARRIDRYLRRTDRPGRREGPRPSGATVKPKKWIFILGGLIFACMFGAVFYFTPNPVDENFCPKNKKGLGVTVLLIDASDSLSKEQKSGLSSELKNLTTVGASRKKALLQKGDRLAVYLLSEDGDDLNKIFDMCNPGKSADRSNVDKATEGKIYADVRWLQFSKKIMSEVDIKISNSSSNQTSPIIETVKNIVSVEFPPADLISEDNLLRLIIASDFLQNSSIANHYQRLQNVKGVFKMKPIDFGGAEVHFWRLNSGSHLHLQTASHLAWWRGFFALGGAKLRQPKHF